jgi:hypothetical protein
MASSWGIAGDICSNRVFFIGTKVANLVYSVWMRDSRRNHKDGTMTINTNHAYVEDLEGQEA